jgi:hypothetical protein
MFESKKVGLSEQDVILSPHNEEITYWNFANPQNEIIAKLEEATMS